MDDILPADFDNALEAYDLVLVNFYAPWCPHCVKFAPIWRQAREQLESTEYSDSVLMAKVDCNANQAYCQDSHSIDHFPTVRAYANSGAEVEEYSGNMAASD